MWLDEVEIADLGLVRPGLAVAHPHFGKGQVEGIKKIIDGDVILQIKFEGVGSKDLVPEYARLQRL